MPIAAATRFASTSSPGGSDGETAVTATAREPSTFAATAATSVESAPPEKATTAPPIRSRTRSSSRSFGEGAVLARACVRVGIARFSHFGAASRPPHAGSHERCEQQQRDDQRRPEQPLADGGVVVPEQDRV